MISHKLYKHQVNIYSIPYQIVLCYKPADGDVLITYERNL